MAAGSRAWAGVHATPTPGTGPHRLQLRAMPEFGLLPDLICCSAVLSALGKGMVWRLAIALFQHLPQLQLMADVISFNIILSACEKAAEWQLAVGILTSMPLMRLQRRSQRLREGCPMAARPGYFRLRAAYAAHA
uniref:Uncharacterized protein n=1 Tax=Alexandrium monilatum TaxID=311494 RepID=A0A6T1JVG4_9DINO|mmetsp:Transcript_14340/g.44928  ORF Transcript_14340/g.44928 Transcript_14340/m.44928 type:complete len:135 (-) Transcript_14340:216-620(-)